MAKNDAGVPLGGIGAGKIELCPNGSIKNISTNNNMDYPIVTGHQYTQFQPISEEGVRGTFGALYVEGARACILKTKSIGELSQDHFETLEPNQIQFRGLFPKAELTFLTLGVELSLLAFSPLVLGEDGKQTRYKDSSLPVALFCYKLKNPGQKKLRVSIAFSWHNLAGVGGYSGKERWIEGKLVKPPFTGGIEDTKDNFCQFQNKSEVQGLWFSHHGKKQNPRFEGNYSLLIEAPTKGQVSYFAGWDVDGDGRDFWEDFSTDGRFNDTTASGNAGALACSIELKPGQEETVTFVVGWYFPNLLASIDRNINYGHAYGNWFQDSWEAASYALTNWCSLLEKTEAWQKRLTDSNLPDWFVTKLINDLFTLFTNSWYTQDFRFSSNESPTHKNGCFGTIDQRAASNSIYTMAFPELSRAELKLFGDQQIDANHPNRYGTHWNFQTGAFDLNLDRLGAIRHDLGWDDLEGGGMGNKDWATLHWPDLVTVYTLQAFEYYLWTNDREFFDYVYPKIKLALEFENRLDQDGDGIAEIWGPGSNTYDSEVFPYFGASPFVATLHLAALRAAEQMADWKGDTQFKIFCQTTFYKVHQSLMEKLWDDQRGHFHNWVDSLYTNWAVGERPHNERSESCFIGQLAGTWFTRLLNLEPILDKETDEQALAKMTELNNHLVSHCPANEVTPEGKASASWIYYVETYYCANCLYGNQKDAGFEAEKKIARAKYQTHQSPWDSPLNWEGAGNSVAGWGRWYMTNPASWFLLLAIEGIHLNLPNRELKIKPNIPTEIGGGKELKKAPVFMPTFWADLDGTYGENQTTIRLEIVKRIGDAPLIFETLILGIPEWIEPSTVCQVRVVLNGQELLADALKPDPSLNGLIVDRTVDLTKEGSVLEAVIEY